MGIQCSGIVGRARGCVVGLLAGSRARCCARSCRGYPSQWEVVHVDRTRGVVVAVWASIVALVAGVGAGAYWGWWNAIQKQTFRESPPALPMVVMGTVAVIAALVALVIGLVLALTPQRE